MTKELDEPYDNCIGVKEAIIKPVTLEDFIETDGGVDTENKEWKKHWVGMPEFEQENNPSYKKIHVHFRTKEDFEEFQKLISQKMTDKTKSVWHPKLSKDDNKLQRWLEIEE